MEEELAAVFVSNSIFKYVLRLTHYAGFQLTANKSKFSKLTNHVYLGILFVMFFSQIVCLSITLLFKLSKDDGSGVFCVIVIMVNNITLIIFYTLKEHRISENYVIMANFVERIIIDDDSDVFVKELNKYARIINGFIHYYMVSVYVLLVFEVFIKGVSYMNLMDLVTEESQLIYVFPWEVNNITFWLTLVFQAVSTAVMTVVQQANNYYLMTMMILQTLCFRHLRISLDHALKPIKKKDSKFNPSKLQLLRPLYENQLSNKNYSWYLESRVEERVKNWIVMHIQLRSICKEFVQIYSPLLITYFAVMFLVLISGLFSITQNHHYYSKLEEVLLGLYFSGIIFNLFMLSVAGSNLTFESLRTFESAFHGPWYKCNRKVTSALMVVCEAAKRPVCFAAFNSHNYNMSLHTFIWVMRTMGSFYMGLVQIKYRSNQRVN